MRWAIKLVCEYGRGRFSAEVAIVVPPPAVNTCRVVEIWTSVPLHGGRRTTWNEHTAAVAASTFIRRVSAFACCRPSAAASFPFKEETFRTFTRDLKRLRTWLLNCRVTEIAMESTASIGGRYEHSRRGVCAPGVSRHRFFLRNIMPMSCPTKPGLGEILPKPDTTGNGRPVEEVLPVRRPAAAMGRRSDGDLRREERVQVDVVPARHFVSSDQIRREYWQGERGRRRASSKGSGGDGAE